MRALLLSLLVALNLQADPKPQRFTLANGLTVILLETHEHPLVRARVHIALTPGDRPEACADLPERFQHLLDRADRGGRKIGECDRDLEGQGIQVQSAAEPTALTWRVLARSRDQDRALGSLGDLLIRPILDPAAWRNACGLPWDGVLAFHRKVMRPERTLLILHGDLGLEQAKRLVMLSLGTWPTVPGAPTVATPAALPQAGVQALRALLAPAKEPQGPYRQEDLDRARRAWLGRQRLRSLDPEGQIDQALDEALGLAPLEEQVLALSLEVFNR